VRFLRRRRGRDDALDITPLVDVVFLLNIFFLLTSSYYLYQGIKINVPEAPGEPSSDPDVIVAVTRDGLIYLGNETESLSVNDLVRRLRKMVAENKDLTCLIRGDTDCRFGRLVEVYSACLTAGVTKVTVHTKSIVARPTAP
jgi:biopolymer transport protein ExbD